MIHILYCNGDFHAGDGELPYDDQLLTLHCALNNDFLFAHQENGKTAADWLLAAVAGNVEQLGLAWLQAGDAEIKRNIERR